MFKIRIGEKNGRKYVALVHLRNGFPTYVTFDRSIIARVGNYSLYELRKIIAGTPANTDIDIDVCEKDVYATL